MNKAILCVALALCLPSCQSVDAKAPDLEEHKHMQLGTFSLSLAVKNLGKSKAFYEKLGFTTVGGDAKQNWLILSNGATKIGLFQGMFEKNALTFNPGWDSQAQTLPEFEDVRAIQKRLLAAGLELTMKTDEAGEGPGHITLVDPDGNPILIDQHAK